ncbi:uncharacterized protein LOC125947023 [Dermacentor silvarum]|uniref:uncharacterized protein LOC125947023 n=1 Tax=Dermacentor silvarum TaxID=543639 RepID=UPI00210085B4|nr:uncharacterized protein LOC125947023 [Dermacentor silvarum]XP_049527251.1 uncharacterized protein LOC125947023 [Dermacentor silvarum]XP_049527252.1 uncharacterized protein LOC125947023 [Dermacentor silvarum]
MVTACIRQILCFCFLTAAMSASYDREYSEANEVFTYQDPRMMLQHSGSVILFRTSRTWTPLLALCFQSSFIDKNSTTYQRTAEFYAPAKVNQQWSLKFFNLTLQITPEVTVNSQTQIIVEGVRSTGRGHASASRRSFCMLWVAEEALRNPLRHCNFMLLSMCGTPAYNAYTYEQHKFKVCQDLRTYNLNGHITSKDFRM